MKKIWALERKYTKEENIDLYNGLLESIEASDISDEMKAKIKDEVLGKINTAEDTWNIVYGNKNYYTFCGWVRNFLSNKDAEAIRALKAELGKVVYSPEINQKFRDTHNQVKSTYKVVECEAADNWSNDRPWLECNITKENEGVYKYLWATATSKGK